MLQTFWDALDFAWRTGKYIQNLKKQLPSEHENVINEAKGKLWLGQTNEALDVLNTFKSILKHDDHIKKIEQFLGYVQEN